MVVCCGCKLKVATIQDEYESARSSEIEESEEEESEEEEEEEGEDWYDLEEKARDADKKALEREREFKV